MRNVLFLSLLCLFSRNALSQTAEQDSLLKLLSHDLSDTARLRLLGELTELTTDDKVWPEYNRQAYELAQKLVLSHDSVTLKKANTGLATALNNMGLFNNLNGNISEALNYLSTSLELREKLGVKKDISETLHNLGTLHFDLDEPDIALQYLERSARLSDEIKDSINFAISINYIGMIALKKGDLTLAQHCFKTSLQTFKQAGDEESYSRSLDNMGMARYSAGDPDSALAFLRAAEIIQKKYNDRLVLSTSQKNIGYILFRVGKINEALEYGKSALNLARQEGFPREIANAEELLAMIFESKKDFSNAYIHLKEFISYSDSIKNEKARKLTIAEQFKTGYEKRAAADKAEQEKKEVVSLQEISKQKIIINSFFVAAVLLILLSIVLYSRFRLKKKSSDELKKAYADLQATQQQLIHQEKNASLGQLTAGIAHEIKNPLNFITNFSELSEELISEMETGANKDDIAEIVIQLKQNISKIKMHGQRANQIVNGMLQHSRSANLTQQLTNVNRLSEDTCNLAYTGMIATHPGFKCEIEKKADDTIPEIKIVPQDISRVMLNLLNNAFYALKIKMEKDKSFIPRVTISTSLAEDVTKNKTVVEIKIRDNGIGIPESIRKKIFQPFFTNKPTNEGTGLGLSISQDIIKAHGGELKVESSESEFTEFTILLPVN